MASTLYGPGNSRLPPILTTIFLWAENLLNKEFKVDEPNKVWVSDISYIGTEEGWLYLASNKLFLNT